MERRTVLVTGAAGGFGKATVEAFAQDEHFNPIIAADKKDAIHGLFTGHEQVLTARVDIRRREDIKDVVRWVEDDLSGVDILVQSAGVQNSGQWHSYLDEEGNPTPELTEMWETNLRGPLWMMQEVVPGMAERQQGLIFNITSVSEHNRSPFRSPYADFKAVLSGVTYRFASEYGRHGVRIVNVQPGMHRTNLDIPRKWTGKSDQRSAGAAQELYDWWRWHIGGDPANVGHAIYDIATGNKSTERLKVSHYAYDVEGERIFIGWDAHLTSWMDEHVPGWQTMFWCGYNLVYGGVKLTQQLNGKDYRTDQSGNRD